MYADPERDPSSSSEGAPIIILFAPIETLSEPKLSPLAPSEAVILTSLVPSKS